MTVAVNKRAVAAAFGRAAQTYDDFAALQRQSAQLLGSNTAARRALTRCWTRAAAPALAVSTGARAAAT